MPDPSDIPSGFYISTPTNNAIANAPTIGIGAAYGAAVTQGTSKTTGVTINCICPGAIETDIMRDEGPAAAASMGLTYQGLLDWFASEAAIKRLNTCDEVAAVASLLASEAGAGITGSMISVDGGTAAY